MVGMVPLRAAAYPLGGGANPGPRGRSTAGLPRGHSKGRRAYADNGTAEGLALSLSLVRL